MGAIRCSKITPTPPQSMEKCRFFSSKKSRNCGFPWLVVGGGFHPGSPPLASHFLWLGGNQWFLSSSMLPSSKKGSLPAFFVGLVATASRVYHGLPGGNGWNWMVIFVQAFLKTNLKFSEQHMLSLRDIFVQKYSIKNDWTLFNLQPPTIHKDSLGCPPSQ